MPYLIIISIIAASLVSYAAWRRFRKKPPEVVLRSDGKVVAAQASAEPQEMNALIRVTPGGKHGWFRTPYGTIRKPLT